LVTLQKEQSLITLNNPSQTRMDRAMGFNCPDDAPCAASTLGFFNQVYRGAGQLNYYSNPAGPFTWLKVGSVISRTYHPNASCGSQSFKLENKATAALYYYTPYVPNQAALDNLYGTGNSCSSYGNRNFWRFYSDWFGSPIGGGFLLKAAKGDTFLIVDEVKYRISDPELLKSLAPLGPIGTISRAYLDSFATVGDITPLVRNGSTENYFFIDNGKRVRFESCEQVASYGLSCDRAVSLTRSQISALETGGAATNLIIGENSERYLVENGQLREILNDASAASAGITLMSPSAIRRVAVSYLPVGRPIALSGSLVKDRTTGQSGVISNDTFFAIDPETAKDIDFGIWFGGSGATLSSQSISALTPGSVIQSIVADANGQQYLLTKTGKRLIQDTASWVKDAPVLPAAVLDAIVTIPDEIIAPAVVRSTSSTALFLVTNGQLRPIASSDRASVRSSIPDPTIHRISPSALTQMSKGSQVIPPGALVRIGSGGKTFLVDGLSRLHRVPSSSQAAALGLGSVRTVTKSQLSSYKRAGPIGGAKVICNATAYLAVAGKFIRVSEETFSHYPGATRRLDSGTCSTLKLTTTQGSRFIRTPDGKYFLVENGKKRALKNKEQYQKLRGTGPKFIAVDNFFSARLANGSAVKSSATVNEEVSEAPEAESQTSSTPTVSTKTYIVKKGDTLSGIADRFGTTSKILMQLNGITDPNRIQIGQELKLP
jgi:LysM repeat protein